MADPAAIETRDLLKAYGALRAIDVVSLRVEAGRFVSLLGPSGCGKSTLLRAIGGFVDADSGSVLIDGRDVTKAPPARRPINMVFQDYALFPHMTVARNVSFGCEMQGLGAGRTRARVAEALEMLHLSAFADRLPDELSGGQRQRVALARALAPNPSALLLDEPLGALDQKLRLQVQHELKALQRRTGKTFLFVTHDQGEAMSMSDLVAVMRDGRIEQIAPPEELYTRPVNAYVAGFVGAANLVPARIGAVSDTSLEVEVEGAGRIAVPRENWTSRAAPAIGAPVVAVIRPEALSLSGTMPEGDVRFSGHITERSFLGSRVQLRLDGTGTVPLLVEARPGDGISADGPVRAHVSVNQVIVFTQEEGAPRRAAGTA